MSARGTMDCVSSHRSACCLPQQLRQYTFRAGSLPKTFRVRTRSSAVRADGNEEKTSPFDFVAKTMGTIRLKAGQPSGGAGTLRIGRGGAGGFGTLKLQRKPARQGRDPNTVFVAGATGRLGARIVRQLLSLGLNVRAGARNLEQAEQYKQVALAYGLIPPEAAKKLEIVPLDLSDEGSLEAALGNAGKVVCALGASEVGSASGPRLVDGEGSVRLIEVADRLKVEQFVLVTSLGTAKFGWPAGILNLFWGVLFFKRQAEVALEQSSLNYLIVRPGGMERPTDEYKATHNTLLMPRDTTFGGQVSRLQVAELVGAAVVNPELAENKCVEVIAETTAPALSPEQLLSDFPSDISQKDKLEAKAKLAEIKEKVEAAAQLLEDIREVSSEVQSTLAELREKEKAILGEQREVIVAGQQAEQELAELREAAEEAARVESAAKAVLSAAERAGREGRLLTAQEIESIQYPILNPPSQEELAAQREAEERELQAQLDAQRQEAEAAAKKSEDEKKRRQAEIEAKKAEEKRKVEEEKKKKAAEIAAKKKAEEEQKQKKEAEIAAQKKAEEEERKKKEAAIVAQKKAQEEQQRKEAEIAAQKKAEEDKKRKEVEAATLKKAEEERLATEAAAKQKAEAEKKAAEEAKKKAEEEAAVVAAAKAAEEQKTKEAATPAPSSPQRTEANGSAPNPFKAFKLPVFSFGQPAPPKEVPPNVAEARQWIASWRARSLEAKLPQNVSANQK